MTSRKRKEKPRTQGAHSAYGQDDWNAPEYIGANRGGHRGGRGGTGRGNQVVYNNNIHNNYFDPNDASFDEERRDYANTMTSQSLRRHGSERSNAPLPRRESHSDASSDTNDRINRNRMDTNHNDNNSIHRDDNNSSITTGRTNNDQNHENSRSSTTVTEVEANAANNDASDVGLESTAAPGDDSAVVFSLEEIRFTPNSIDGTALRTPNTCNAEPRKGQRVVRIQECMLDEYLKDVNAPRKTCLVAMILSIRTATSNNNKTLVVNATSPRYSNSASGGRRQGVLGGSSGQKYDRILTLADCTSDTGNVFAVLFQNKLKSEEFFKFYTNGGEGVGNLVLLEGVQYVKEHLGTTTNVPLVKDVARSMPLEGDPIKLMAPVLRKKPSKGDTAFFCHHNITNLQLGNVVIKLAICGGSLWYESLLHTFVFRLSETVKTNLFRLFYILITISICSDRQNERTSSAQPCGCFHIHTRHEPKVFEMTVIYPGEPNADKEDSLYVLKFRSYRTSSIFLLNPGCWDEIDHENMDHSDIVGEIVEKINKYINENGGWTMVGWLRTGAVVDQSETNEKVENIASEKQDPHISYLYPSNPAVMKDLAFQQMCVRPRLLHSQQNQQQSV